jgi:hypothetical protein
MNVSIEELPGGGSSRCAECFLGNGRFNAPGGSM